MKSLKIQIWGAETALMLLGVFFFTRELGTFPSIWIDDGIYMLAAKMLANGHNISVPILDQVWSAPSILHASYPFLLPVAVSIKLFGFSIVAARLPMVLFLIASSLGLYALTRSIFGRKEALWSLALLITLSAFVNTGKPVLTEIPSLTFLIYGLLLMPKASTSRKCAVWTGILLGCAILSKVTMALIIPALVASWIAARIRKENNQSRALITILIVTVTLFALWQWWEIYINGTDVLVEYQKRLMSGNKEWHSLAGNISLLLRAPYIYFAILLFFAGVGLHKAKSVMSLMQRNTIIVLLALFLLYFATGPGWYRLLLPTHVLLIPFVTHGIIHITGKKVSIYILIFFIVMQTWWQWSYRGSSRSTAAVETANIIQEQYAEKALIIRQAEIFVQLPEKDHWLFLPHEKMSSRIPTRLTALSEEQKCMWQIQKLGEAQRAEYDSAILLSGSYTLFKPTSCND